MKILGISCFYHDSAATLINDGKIIAAAQEERFTRIKHDQSFPSHAVDFCLKFANCTLADIDAIAFYDKPFLKFERLLENYFTYAPRGLRSFLMAMPEWLLRKLWMGELIRKKLKGYPIGNKIYFVKHHESHAASAFYPSPFERAAILTIDGVGEWTTSSIGVGDGNSIKPLKEMLYPHSLGLLYSAFTYFTGFKVNSGEYKLMGLAPYGKPIYKDLILKELIDLKEDGSFRLNMDYFNYPVGLTMTNDLFAKLFNGPPRMAESQITDREMNLAASIQAVTEEIMIRIARHAKKLTNLDSLCLAGGVALNCVANGRIARENIFKRIWIQPAAGDAGGSLGAALSIYYSHFKKPRSLARGSRDSQKGTLLGTSYDSVHLHKWLKEKNIPNEEFNNDELFLQKIAKLISEGKVIGWFSGRMEFGPRALGARSIIADARNSSIQSELNVKIKFRESFRPFAPSVLVEEAHSWFEFPKGNESPYMLLVAQVAKDKLLNIGTEKGGLDRRKVSRSLIPAVTHIDNSARLQTVNRQDNPRYYDLIKEFYKQTGCPVIVNTSFNVRGEPIVESPEDAYRCFMRTNMDYLVLENFLLDKEKQPQVVQNDSWKEEYQLD
jgi:carbamoyltransferase